MGVEPAVLAGTVTRYNEDVAAGHDTMFEKRRPGDATIAFAAVLPRGEAQPRPD